MGLVNQLQKRSGTPVKKDLFTRQRYAEHRPHQLLVVVLQQSPVILGRIRIMKDAQVVDGNQTDPGAAVLKRAAQAPVPRVGKNAVNQRGGDEDGMARLSANGRAGQLCVNSGISTGVNSRRSHLSFR